MLKELYVRARSSKRPTRLHAPSWRLTSQHLSMKDSHPKFAFWYLQHKNTVSDEGSWEKDGRSTVRTWERGEKGCMAGSRLETAIFSETPLYVVLTSLRDEGIAYCGQKQNAR